MTQKILRKILIIDDDEDVLLISKHALSSSSAYEVTCVNSGELGLKTAAELQPDLILLDVKMPIMDGIETLKKIKENPSIAKTSVVFFVSHAEDKEITDYLKLGAIAVIVKPIEPMDLPALVQEIWHKYHS